MDLLGHKSKDPLGFCVLVGAVHTSLSAAHPTVPSAAAKSAALLFLTLCKNFQTHPCYFGPLFMAKRASGQPS